MPARQAALLMILTSLLGAACVSGGQGDTGGPATTAGQIEIPAEIEEALRSAGSARLIVNFNTNHPEFGQGIPAFANALIDEMAGLDVVVLRRYESLPQVVLRVDREILQRLRQSARVASLSADSRARPGDEPCCGKDPP